MKKKAILSALFSAFVACFFVACSNDSDALDINAGTRSVTSSYMTREEVQARLDEIGDRYGTQVIIDKTVNWGFITEDVFTDLEEHLSIKGRESSNKNSTRKYAANINENDSLSLNDSSIDDIMLMAAPPSGETYSGSFNHTMDITCGVEYNSPTTITINWHTNSLGVSSLALSAIITSGHGSSVSISYTNVGGAPTSPSFKYSGSVNCNTAILKCDTIFMKDEMGDGLNHTYDQIIDGEFARLEYYYDAISKEHEFSGFYPQ